MFKPKSPVPPAKKPGSVPAKFNQADQLAKAKALRAKGPRKQDGDSDDM